jgi:hypothetical protein
MGTSKWWFRLGVVVATVATPLASLAPDAGASLPVVTGTCGMVVQSSMRLANDMTCTGTAMQIDGFDADVVVDLGGHTVWTTDPGQPPVYLEAGPVFGFNAVTLQNGRVKGAGRAGNAVGNPIIYKKLVFDGGGVASDQYWHGNVDVVSSVFLHGASITANRSKINIAHNHFIGDGSGAIAVDLSTSASTVTTNTIAGYGVGVATGGTSSSIDLENNHITGNGVGMDLSFAAPASGVVTRNTVSFNRTDGIVIGVGTNLLVSKNAASSNGHDGIRVDPTTNGSTSAITLTLTANTANTNADWGIESPGDIPPDVTVTDGGGNVARGNYTGKCLDFTCV